MADLGEDDYSYGGEEDNSYWRDLVEIDEDGEEFEWDDNEFWNLEDYLKRHKKPKRTLENAFDNDENRNLEQESEDDWYSNEEDDLWGDEGDDNGDDNESYWRALETIEDDEDEFDWEDDEIRNLYGDDNGDDDDYYDDEVDDWRWEL